MTPTNTTADLCSNYQKDLFFVPATKTMMKKEYLSTLMCGLALFCGSSQVCAQTPAASYRKVKAASPIVSLGKFILSTTPNANVPPGSPGSTGNKSEMSYWDGETMKDQPDPEGGPPDQVPDERRLAPEERDYYVVVTGILTVPSTIVTPASVQVTARRVRYTTNAQGQQVVTEMDEADEVTMYKVTQSNQGKPVVNSNGTTTYTYRTHDLMDEEELPHRKGGALDWKINDKKGRWQLQVKDYASNTVEFKIDKRGQLTGYGLEWADFYEYKRNKAMDDENEDELIRWSKILHPDRLFTHCFSFAGHIYNRHGLDIDDSDGRTMFPAASAEDTGPGSLRFYWSTAAVNNGWILNPGHVAVIGPPSWAAASSRIDNNGLPADGDAYNGPKWRTLDEGGYVTGPLGYVPISKTLPATQGGTKPNSTLAKSLLEELDEE